MYHVAEVAASILLNLTLVYEYKSYNKHDSSIFYFTQKKIVTIRIVLLKSHASEQFVWVKRVGDLAALKLNPNKGI